MRVVAKTPIPGADSKRYSSEVHTSLQGMGDGLEYGVDGRLCVFACHFELLGDHDNQSSVSLLAQQMVPEWRQASKRTTILYNKTNLQQFMNCFQYLQSAKWLLQLMNSTKQLGDA